MDFSIDSRQIRAARALLNWNQSKLAEVANVTRSSIKNIENELTIPHSKTAMAIQEAFEKFGVEFIPNSGVRMKSQIVTVLEGSGARFKFMDMVFNTMKAQGGGTVLVASYREPYPDTEKERYDFEFVHLERYKKYGITQRLLIKEGDCNLIWNKESYRWVPEKYFSPYPFVIYEKKLGMISMDSPEKVVIVDDPLFAESFSKIFEFMWDNGSVPAV